MNKQIERGAFVCEEYGEVDLPISAVLLDGELIIYPEVSGAGYFDIDYRNDKLRLIAKGYVGVVPINSRVTINVIPRFPIANVFYLVQRSEGALRDIPGFFRSYGQSLSSTERLEELFGALLLNTAKLVSREGLPRRYIAQRVTGGARGRLLFSETISKHFCKQQRHLHVREFYRLTSDSPENRAVKTQITILERYFAASGSKASRDLALKARMLCVQMNAVNDGLESTSHHINALQAAIRSHSCSAEYLSILWLSYLLTAKRGVTLASFGSVATSSLLVNMAGIFESYVREVVRRELPKLRNVKSIVDGNAQPIPLFKDNTLFSVKPDVLVLLHDAAPVVIDAKYKPKMSAADRYEVISFCEATGAKLAILISPLSNRDKGKERIKMLGVTTNGIQLFEQFIDLSNNDMGSEEIQFVSELNQICDRYASRRD